ncbi:trigger factor [Aminipila butyrica]|uniref:peptidylprolyl isomerase n=1 Tax=Aminipila butyrica TaxID=433296 RepID=A0A858BWC4_9FIRM|nr:trigger factor [Aminipila butyrica]QIB69887.1 trigger factor [Aminipila butyrica]
MDEMIRMNSGKRKVTALLVLSCLTLSLAACGNSYEVPYSDYDLSEYVTLGDYKGVQVTETKVSVTPEEVQAEIQKRLTAAGKQVEKTEGTAAEGDSVKLIYVGKLDGVPFENGSTGDEGTTITLGSSGYIDGFDAGVVGMKVGQMKTLHLTFPEDYGKDELNGQNVDFDVTLGAIMVTETPTYDLAFVKANSSETSLADYEKSVKKELYKTKQESAEEETKNQLWASIMDNAKVLKYPEKEVQAAKDTNEEYYENYAKQYNMELKDFVKQYAGMDEKAYADYQQQYAEAIISQEMVMYSIAKAEGISISDKEYKEKLAAFKADQGVTDDKAFKDQYGQSFEEYAGKDNLMKSFLLEKVIQFALDNAKVVPAEQNADAANTQA